MKYDRCHARFPIPFQASYYFAFPFSRFLTGRYLPLNAPGSKSAKRIKLCYPALPHSLGGAPAEEHIARGSGQPVDSGHQICRSRLKCRDFG